MRRMWGYEARRAQGPVRTPGTGGVEGVYLFNRHVGNSHTQLRLAQPLLTPRPPSQRQPAFELAVVHQLVHIQCARAQVRAAECITVLHSDMTIRSPLLLPLASHRFADLSRQPLYSGGYYPPFLPGSNPPSAWAARR